MEFTLTITGNLAPEQIAEMLKIAAGGRTPSIAKAGPAEEELEEAPGKSAHKLQPTKTTKPAKSKADQNGEEKITLESLTDAVREKVGEGKTGAIKKLLAKFDAPKASELDPEKYGDFMAQLNKL